MACLFLLLSRVLGFKLIRVGVFAIGYAFSPRPSPPCPGVEDLVGLCRGVSCSGMRFLLLSLCRFNRVRQLLCGQTTWELGQALSFQGHPL